MQVCDASIHFTVSSHRLPWASCIYRGLVWRFPRGSDPWLSLRLCLSDLRVGFWVPWKTCVTVKEIFQIVRGLILVQANYSTPQAKTTVFIPSPFSQKHPFFLSIKKICIQQSFFTIFHSVVCAVHSHATTWPTWSISRRFLRSVMGAVGPVRSLADK